MKIKELPWVWIIPTLLIVGFTIYNVVGDNFGAKEINEYKNEHIQEYKNVLNIDVQGDDENNYFILFYDGIEEGYTSELNDTVINYKRNTGNIPLLFFNVDPLIGEDVDPEYRFRGPEEGKEDEYYRVDPESGRETFNHDINEDVRDPNEILLLGFPSLIYVNDGEVITTLTSVEIITSFLEQ